MVPDVVCSPRDVECATAPLLARYSAGTGTPSTVALSWSPTAWSGGATGTAAVEDDVRESVIPWHSTWNPLCLWN